MFKARKEQLKDFKKLIRITKKLVTIVKERNSLEGAESSKRANYLSSEIEEYVTYIASKSHDFINFDLTQEEYKSCECDDLSIFIILLILKNEIKEIEKDECAECILLDDECHYSFRKRIFLYDNDVRKALCRQLKCSTKALEKHDDLLGFPIFLNLDFESFAKLI